MNVTDRKRAIRNLPKRNAYSLYVDVLTTTKIRQLKKQK